MAARTATAEVVPFKRQAKPRRRHLLTAAHRRTVGQGIAAIAGAFLPVASYVLSHQEVQAQPAKWGLVVAALAFSAPTLATWAQRWCRSPVKAWGFTILLEGVMVFSSTQPLGWAGLGILVAINCHSAFHLASGKVK
jgi:hypothetical protein